MLSEINTWLKQDGRPAFSRELAALYEARLGGTRRHQLALALLITALAVVTSALLDHANAPVQFHNALLLRLLSISLCLGGAMVMLRAKAGLREACIYGVPLLAQMALAVWVGVHGSALMIDRNILGSLILFAVLCSVPPVPGKVSTLLAALLFGFFVVSFLVIAGPAAFWSHRMAALAGALSLTVGAILSHRRDRARKRSFVQGLRAEFIAEELGRVNAEAERLMHTDVLTGVANRRRFEADMKLAWPSLQSGGGLGLLLVDVDHFKAFNDFAGHAEGDICLRQIAQAIAAMVRGGGFSMARWGGEEFVVLAPGIARDDMAGLGERVRQSVEFLSILHPASPGRRVTVSLGAAWCGKDTPCGTPEDLLRSADRSLYQAKRQGRNCVAGPEGNVAVLA